VVLLEAGRRKTLKFSRFLLGSACLSRCFQHRFYLPSSYRQAKIQAAGGGGMNRLHSSPEPADFGLSVTRNCLRYGQRLEKYPTNPNSPPLIQGSFKLFSGGQLGTVGVF
jgi:hypothetical protein